MANDLPKLPIHVESIQPILYVRDIAASRRFYIDILGFAEEPWGDDNFTGVSRDGCSIYLCQGAQGNPATWLWLGFDGDIFELYTLLQERGVKIRQSPVNYPWALEMQIEDPDGHILRLGTQPDANETFAD